MKCHNCGAEVNNAAKFCRNCGTEIDNGKYCLSCGSELKENSLFCGVCGAKTGESGEYKTYCKKCGEELKYGAVFCSFCGTPAGEEPQEEINQAEAMPALQKKNNAGLIVLIIILVLILAGCVGSIAYMVLDDYFSDDEIIYVEKEDEKENKKEEDKEEEIVEEEEYDEEYEEYSSPIFPTVKATSILPQSGENTYVPENLRDGAFSTSWTEGEDGSGIGEKIKFTSTERQKVSGIRILNGYCKSEEIYINNNRVNEIRIRCSTGEIFEEFLNDVYGEYTVITFSEPVICSEIELEILSVIYGEKYDDTCMTEIEFF